MDGAGRIHGSAIAILIVGLPLLSSTSRAEDFTEVMSTGAHAWGDYNNDGWSDLFGGPSLWTNNGDGTFTRTEPFGGLHNTANVSLGDYNNDGYLDVYGYVAGELDPAMTGASGPKLYTNNAGTGWTDDRARFGSLLPGVTPAWVHRATTWGDFNGDGFLDTYVSAWCEPWLGPPDDDLIYTGNGGDSFTHTWTSPTDYFGKGVTTFDFDRDGDLDIYVSNYWLTPNLLWRNDGFDGTTGLVDVAGAHGVNDGGHTQGSAVGDFNNDGELDLFISNFAHPGNPQLRFMENRGASGGFRFTDRGTGGVAQMEPLDAAAVADFDNDGHLDLFLTVSGGYGGERPQLYRNNGDWTFGNVTSTHGLGGLRASHEGPGDNAAWGDYDNDGFVDLLADNRLWRNPGAANWPDHHYLRVRLEGGNGNNGLVNSAAIGAQVRIEVPGLGTVTRQVEGGTGQGMQNDLTLHFGLGDHGDPVDLEILWPEGSTQTVFDVPVDQFLTIPIDPDPPPPPPAVAEGHEITFLRGSARPPADWTEPGFDDAAWEVGRLGIGYGDNDDMTRIPDMENGYAAVFGRASFDLRELGLRRRQLVSLELRVRFDDGFVVYLNGEEIARPNMPEGRVSRQTLATATVGDAPAVCEVDDWPAGCAVLSVPVDLVVDGENVLAFSVHNVELTSTDLSFIPTLTMRTKEVEPERFRRGDVDGSGRQEITDAIRLLDFLFLRGREPACTDAADVDDSGTLNITDPVLLLQALFQGAAERVPPPGLDCGPDPTADALEECSTPGC